MMRAMLVNCVAYEDGRKLADIAVEDISDYVSRPGCFVWVALADPTDAELALMAQEFGLHELAVEDVKKGNQAPKIEEYGDTLFCVMRTVETSPPPDETLL
jgi:magnesium transporter